MAYEEAEQIFLQPLRFSPVHRTPSISVASGTDPSVTLESSTCENLTTIPSSTVSKMTVHKFLLLSKTNKSRYQQRR